MSFLNILINRNENGVWSDLYRNTKISKTHRDTRTCLSPTSMHHNHYKLDIFLGQMICTIAEKNATKLMNLKNLKSSLSK